MELTFREAVGSDLRELVLMLADDHLSATREDTSEPLNEAYVQAFEAIERDPNNELVVVEIPSDQCWTEGSRFLVASRARRKNGYL